MGEIPKNPELAESERKVGLKLTDVDLAELALAARSSNSQNWLPGQVIQIATFNLRTVNNLDDLRRVLLNSGKYREEEKGGNTIFRPTDKPDPTKIELVQKVGLSGLKTLWQLALLDSDNISGMTVLPNTSLGRRERSLKTNGVLIQLRGKPSQEILGRMKWNVGRHISVSVLRGLDVEGFIEKFCDGEALRHPNAKICDFYFNQNGMVYLLVAAGGQPIDAKTLQGPIWHVTKEMKRWEEKQRANLSQVVSDIIKAIGRGVAIEEMVTHPYIYYNPASNQLVSGAFDGTLTVVNSGKKSPLILTEDKGITPVGNSGHVVSQLIKWWPIKVVMSLTPVRNFGLPGS